MGEWRGGKDDITIAGKGKVIGKVTLEVRNYSVERSRKSRREITWGEGLPPSRVIEKEDVMGEGKKKYVGRAI